MYYIFICIHTYIIFIYISNVNIFPLILLILFLAPVLQYNFLQKKFFKFLKFRFLYIHKQYWLRFFFSFMYLTQKFNGDRKNHLIKKNFWKTSYSCHCCLLIRKFQAKAHRSSKNFKKVVADNSLFNSRVCQSYSFEACDGLLLFLMTQWYF